MKNIKLKDLLEAKLSVNKIKDIQSLASAMDKISDFDDYSTGMSGEMEPAFEDVPLELFAKHGLSQKDLLAINKKKKDDGLIDISRDEVTIYILDDAEASVWDVIDLLPNAVAELMDGDEETGILDGEDASLGISLERDGSFSIQLLVGNKEKTLAKKLTDPKKAAKEFVKAVNKYNKEYLFI